MTAGNSLRPTSQTPAEATKGKPSARGLVVRGVGHSYEGAAPALQSVSLEIADGDFCTFLGPSGSGKTTLLKILAGLLTPSSGRVLIGGEDVTNRPVEQRDIGFVFQHYALFPHLSVRENVAYPLRVRKVPRAQREQMVNDVLEMVQLEGFGARSPGELSGGQQQRVAVARALVFRPRLLLLDEPLGALDRRLRQSVGTDLRRIQKEAGITAIYVTHDQEEAFILSDKLVVMNQGRVHQIGVPIDAYDHPADEFVARFLGDTNIVGSGSDSTRRSIRPERVLVRLAGDDPPGCERLGTGVVVSVRFLGAYHRVAVETTEGVRLEADLPRADGLPSVDDKVTAWATPESITSISATPLDTHSTV